MKYFIPNDAAGLPRTDVVVAEPYTLWIPKDPENSDYQRFLEWVAAGGVPEPWQP